jgi:hypothetical protein
MAAGVAFLDRRAMRSASIATDRPTVLRYLKQSTTLLAGLKILTGTLDAMLDTAVNAFAPKRTKRTGG